MRNKYYFHLFDTYNLINSVAYDQKLIYLNDDSTLSYLQTMQHITPDIIYILFNPKPLDNTQG